MNWYSLHQDGKALAVSISGEIGVDQSADDLVLAILAADRVTLTVNSVGGDSLVAMRVARALRSRPHTEAHIVHALSAALVIACACKRVTIDANARVMVHAAQAGCLGTVQDLRRTADRLAALRSDFEAVFAAKTGNAAMVRKWLESGDHWFTARKALSAKLVDAITEPKRDAVDLIAAADPVARESRTPEEQLFFDLLAACGRLRVSDRNKFMRELTSFAHQTTEAK